MRFDVITLFPELFDAAAARTASRVAPSSRGRSTCGCGRCATSPRTPTAASTTARIGGGPGMVMLAEPLRRALAAARGRAWRAPRRWSISRRPAGGSTRRWCASSPPARARCCVCGRYEGIDQRFIDRHVTHEISLGDFVLSGRRTAGAGAARRGGAAAARRAERAQSHQQDSFSARAARRPALQPAGAAGVGRGRWPCRRCCCPATTPQIARWRRERALELTARRRPDLIDAARAAGTLDAGDERFLRCLEAIIKGFSILCRGRTRPQAPCTSPTPQRRGTIDRRTPWT